MRESMEILSDPEMTARVRAGRRAVATADVVGLEELSGGSPPPPGPWRVVLTGPVARQLEERDVPAAMEVRQMLVTLATSPAEVGHALGMGLVGVWSAHAAAHRILYAIQERERLVTVLTVDPG
jgi:mRNA-degrading endonuclease RelE of RelBE toxin-antitoxin system